MSIIREILCCSNVGYSWEEFTDDTQAPVQYGFTVFTGNGLDFDDCHEIDVVVTGWQTPRSLALEMANDAFVEHHAWEVELEAMHRPLILTIEDEGALRFNPLTILRAS